MLPDTHRFASSKGNRPNAELLWSHGEIDYGQLYAQALYELREAKPPYWFSNDEVARIQELNQDFMQQKDIAEMVEICFRKPNEGEASRKNKLSPRQQQDILQIIALFGPTDDLAFDHYETGYDFS